MGLNLNKVSQQVFYVNYNTKQKTDGILQNNDVTSIDPSCHLIFLKGLFQGDELKI